MQPRAGIGAQSYDIAGVRGNFRLIQNDVEHGEDRSLWLMAALFMKVRRESVQT